MSRDQLEIVQTLAERHEKEAGGRLSAAQEQLASTQSQLNQVLDYRVDYYALATGSGKAGKLAKAREKSRLINIIH